MEPSFFLRSSHLLLAFNSVRPFGLASPPFFLQTSVVPSATLLLATAATDPYTLFLTATLQKEENTINWF